MKSKKLLLSLLLLALISTVFVFKAFAHNGKTDANGGHRDDQNQSGLGSYHYHCGGYPAHLHTNGACPYTIVGVPSSSSSTSSSSVDNEESYDYGYEKGYEKGYEAGQSEGYSEGFAVGHDEGYDYGYNEGYHDKEVEQREETTKNFGFLAIIIVVIFLCYKLISHFKKGRE